MSETKDDSAATLSLHRIWLPAVLFSIAVALTVFYVWIGTAVFRAGETVPELLKKLDVLFNLNEEHTIPTWYSAGLWAFSSTLAFFVALAEKQAGRTAWHWWFITFLFLLLSLDESAILHEQIGSILDKNIEGSGLLSWSWIYYGFALVLVSGVVLWRFLLSLPLSILVRFVLAATIFLSGALGVEMYSASVYEGEAAFPPWLNWRRIIAIEEFLEMTGVVLNISALLSFARGRRLVTVGVR